MVRFTDELENNQEAREAMAERLMNMVSRAKSNMDKMGMREKIKQDEDYYNYRNTIKGMQYNDIRYNKSFEDAQMFLSLFTAAKPGFSFRQRHPLYTPLSTTMNAFDKYQKEKAQFDFQYSMAILDSLKFGTGYIVPELIETKNGLRMKFATPTIAEVLLGDVTNIDTWTQPYIVTEKIIDKFQAEERWGSEVVSSLNPGEEGENLDLLQNIVQNVKDYVFGIDESKSMYDQVTDQWKCGNVVIEEIMERRSGNLYKGYIANGKLVEYLESESDYYPHCKYVYKPQNKHAFGFSVTDITKSYTDAITRYLQLMVRYLGTVCGGVYLLPKEAGLSKADFRDIIQDGFAVLPIPAKLLALADKAFRPISPPAMPSGVIEGTNFLMNLISKNHGSTNYLSGMAVPNEDSGAKVAFMQQAGMGIIKRQVEFYDKDPNYKLGVICLENYQRYFDEHEIIEVRGKKDANGNPNFMDINLEADEQMLVEGLKMAMSGKGVEMGVTMFSPEEFIAQYKMIEDRLEQKAEGDGSLPIPKIHDLAAGELQVSIISNTEVDQTTADRKRSALLMREVGDMGPIEHREINNLPIDNESLSQVPSMVKVTPVDQYMAMFQQYPPGSKEHGDIMEQMMGEFAAMEKVVGLSKGK